MVVEVVAAVVVVVVATATPVVLLDIFHATAHRVSVSLSRALFSLPRAPLPFAPFD